MTLKDISHGPDWILWMVFVIFAVISIACLTGHGKNLIAGFNTAGKEEQEKYDVKKLSRMVGIGMSVLTILILIMTIGLEILPASFVYIFLTVTFVDCIFMIVSANKLCKK